MATATKRENDYFWKFSHPYAAIIMAKNECEALAEYQESVADAEDSDFDIISRDETRKIVAQSLTELDDIMTLSIKIEMYDGGDSELLLIDKALA